MLFIRTGVKSLWVTTKATLLCLSKSALSTARQAQMILCFTCSGSPVCALRVGRCGAPVSLKRVSALHPGWLCNCIWIVWWGMLPDFIDVNWKYHGITVWRAFYRFLRGENVLRLLEGIAIGKNLWIKYCHGHFWNMTTRKWRWWALVTHKHLYTVYLSYLEG